MYPIVGKITERLLRLFGPDSPGWDPPRDTGGSVAPTKKIPKGVEGTKQGKGLGRKKDA